MPFLDAAALAPPPAIVSFDRGQSGKSRKQADVRSATEQYLELAKYNAVLQGNLLPVIKDAKGHLFRGEWASKGPTDADLKALSLVIENARLTEEVIAERIKFMRTALSQWPKNTDALFLDVGKRIHNLLVEAAELVRDARWAFMALRAEITPRPDDATEGKASDLRRAVNAIGT